MSNSINKSDFYYGTFLTKVLDRGNKAALVSKDDGRGIYKLTTDKKEYIVYLKYATNNKKSEKRWTFNYTNNNIEEIEMYANKNEDIIFGFICAYKDLRNSETGIAYLKELKKCMDPDCKVNKSKRVTIYKKSYSPVLRMYGTKRADMKDQQDNTIHLDRVRINEL